MTFEECLELVMAYGDIREKGQSVDNGKETIPALAELRRWFSGFCVGEGLARDEVRQSTITAKGKVDELTLAAEDYVASHFLRLPLDHDGVPIRPYEELWDTRTHEHVPGPNVYGVNEMRVFIYDHAFEDSLISYDARHFSHNRPEPLTDVLIRFYDRRSHIDSSDSDELRAVYADCIAEIRELCGGGRDD